MRPFVNALKASPVVLAFAVMLVMSWRRWADLIVDYGREVYVPWRLSEGSVLYRDVASFYGPLSSYVNSVIFRVFGDSLIWIQSFNILLIVALAYFIYRLFEEDGDKLTPVVVSVAFLVLFAFGKQFNLGSYNYVAPYSHELVHGLFLSFAAIYALRLYVRSGRLLWVILGGFLTGLVLLTKMEIALGAVLAVFPGFAFAFRENEERVKRGFGLLAASAATPVVLAIGYFSVYMGAAEAIRSVFSSWAVVAGTDISTGKFYKAVTGVDKLGENIRGMFISASWFLILLVPLVAAFLLKSNAFFKRFGAPVSFVAAGAALAYFSLGIPWDLLFWPLPVFAAAIAVYFLVRLLRRNGAGQERDIPLFALSIFAGALLLKIVFVTRIYGYGFVLAMPATILVIYMLLCRVPSHLGARWGTSGILRYSVLAAIVVMLSFYWVKSYRHYAAMDYEVGEGGDMVIASGYSGGKGVDILLEQIDKVMAPGDDFIIMPEGTLVNYLSRRKNPTPYVTFLPTDMTIYGEKRMLSALEKSPPDFIILISRDTIEYGVHYLGQGYGESIYRFIMDGYSPVVRIGNLGFLERSVGMSQPLGILIMKRIDG